ncbi:MAG: phosphatidylserine decarboxylase, partial [Bacilli bacterium]|nr:phosphatidylserine decarboxylase [Bacilli bacterium]
SIFKIKNSLYNLESLLKDKKLADEYKNGVCLIFRLTPDNYHRYCYIDNGKVVSSKKIKGVLHTVRPIALNRYNVYIQNTREYTVIETENFEKVIQMEVGAMFIGRITNHTINGKVHRGEEKGTFEFGGSTIVMIFKENTVKIDKIISQNTIENKETVIKMGNIIGKQYK